MFSARTAAESTPSAVPAVYDRRKISPPTPRQTKKVTDAHRAPLQSNAVPAVYDRRKLIPLTHRQTKKVTDAHRAPLQRTLLTALLTALSPLAAADKEPPPPASLLFVNAVGDKGLAFLVIGGADANPAGFPVGTVTGWVQFPAGELSLLVEHQPLGTVDLTRELQPGSRQAFIAHNLIESQADRGRPPRPTIGVLALPCQRAEKKVKASKRLVVIVNATLQDSLPLIVGGEKAAAARLKPLELQVDSGTGFVPVEADPAEGEPLATLNLEEPVVTYVVVHETAEGGLNVISFAEPLPPEEE